MRSVEILSALGLLNGSTLLMGLQRGLASSADVEGYCMALLGSSEDHDTALLAPLEALSEVIVQLKERLCGVCQ
jgi:hypothetical protein